MTAELGFRAPRDQRRPDPLPALTDVRRQLAEYGLGDEDLAAWEQADLPVEVLGDWVTDRVARRPSGATAREVYGAEDIHVFARRAILESLDLGPGDRLLDVGCGGGVLLRDTLAAGAEAVGLDHSPEMVELARERAPGAQVLLGDATELPFGDGEFTAVSMSIVLMFLTDPVTALRESRRVLREGGRIAVYTSSTRLLGTPALPPLVAERSRFYDDEELARLATTAGFDEVRVADQGGGQLLTARCRSL